MRQTLESPRSPIGGMLAIDVFTAKLASRRWH